MKHTITITYQKPTRLYHTVKHVLLVVNKNAELAAIAALAYFTEKYPRLAERITDIKY